MPRRAPARDTRVERAGAASAADGKQHAAPARAGDGSGSGSVAGSDSELGVGSSSVTGFGSVAGSGSGSGCNSGSDSELDSVSDFESGSEFRLEAGSPLGGESAETRGAGDEREDELLSFEALEELKVSEDSATEVSDELEQLYRVPESRSEDSESAVTELQLSDEEADWLPRFDVANTAPARAATATAAAAPLAARGEWLATAHYANSAFVEMLVAQLLRRASQGQQRVKTDFVKSLLALHLLYNVLLRVEDAALRRWLAACETRAQSSGKGARKSGSRRPLLEQLVRLLVQLSSMHLAAAEAVPAALSALFAPVPAAVELESAALQQHLTAVAAFPNERRLLVLQFCGATLLQALQRRAQALGAELRTQLDALLHSEQAAVAKHRLDQSLDRKVKASEAKR